MTLYRLPTGRLFKPNPKEIDVRLAPVYTSDRERARNYRTTDLTFLGTGMGVQVVMFVEEDGRPKRKKMLYLWPGLVHRIAAGVAKRAKP